MVPDSDWSPWTRPYQESGEEVKSPLRKYLQIRARVMADTLSKYGPPASLHAIRVNLTDLYAEELIGEVWPRFVERIGEPEERSFFIRPRFTRSDQSFDRFRITATAPTTMELVEVRAGKLEEFAQGETERWLPEAAGDHRRRERTPCSSGCRPRSGRGWSWWRCASGRRYTVTRRLSRRG